jgi:hypothetical protein
MAQVTDNLVTEGASGKLGKRLVFRHMKDGRTILATRPNYSGYEWTTGQRTHHSRFKEAAAYARVASKANPLYEQRTRGTAKNAYNLALSDWFHAPVIHDVARYPGRIRIDATDNVLVTRVVVTLSDEQGQILEQGEAKLINDAWWEYATAAPSEAKIIVEAFDLARNVAKQEA